MMLSRDASGGHHLAFAAPRRLQRNVSPLLHRTGQHAALAMSRVIGRLVHSEMIQRAAAAVAAAIVRTDANAPLMPPGKPGEQRHDAADDGGQTSGERE